MVKRKGSLNRETSAGSSASVVSEGPRTTSGTRRFSRYSRLKRKFDIKDSVFRCEEMSLYEMYLSNETAYECLAEIGELDAVQFRNLKPEDHFVEPVFEIKIRMCSEMERRLRYFEKELENADIDIPKLEESFLALKPEELPELDTILHTLENELQTVTVQYAGLRKTYLDLSQMEHVVLTTDVYFGDEAGEETLGRFLHKSSSVMTQTTRSSLISGPKSSTKFGSMHDSIEQQMRDEKYRDELGLRINILTGVVPQKNIKSFQTMLYRISHGNLYVDFKAIEKQLDDPDSPVPVYKSVFVIYFQGESLRDKLMKICNAFNSTLYNCPQSNEERAFVKNVVAGRMKDIQIAIEKTDELRRKILIGCARSLKMWQLKVLKMKSVYYILNRFDSERSSNYLIAECWIPVSHFEMVSNVLHKTNEQGRGSVPPILIKMHIRGDPPTFNTTNKYSKVIQQLIDSYGYAQYGEINPAPFTIITFPFLFGVMFGDLGHGFIMFLCGITFILTDNQVKWEKMGEIIGIFFEGRYLIMLMGLFSMYTGLIYNECFSIPMNLFGSSWSVNVTAREVLYMKEIELDPEKDFSMQPYPFGMDPVWLLSENELNIYNSVKMKISIILGVTHMTFGVFLGLWNFIFFKHPESIIGQFIPHLIFLTTIFGYMVFLIFYKWGSFGPHPLLPWKSIKCAPSILTTMIQMVMVMKPKKASDPDCREEMYNYQVDIIGTSTVTSKDVIADFNIDAHSYFRLFHAGFAGNPTSFSFTRDSAGIMTLQVVASNTHFVKRKIVEFYVQIVLLCVGMLCIPWMLFYKPLHQILTKNHQAKKTPLYRVQTTPLSSTNFTEDSFSAHSFASRQTRTSSQETDFQEEGEITTGEAFIYQGIHTIEFVLGCVSHTASYLRLWALSLAHSQLSKVLWDMVFKIGFQFKWPSGTFVIFFVFFIWATFTVAILILMEGLSAFLHTLRLHWVEFQSKFYSGLGHGFAPFSFRNLLNK